MTELTVQRLVDVVDYDANTGAFVWKHRALDVWDNRRWNTRFAGRLAGHVDQQTGYRHICVDGERYRAHRLAWFYAYGVWPSDVIDHINGNQDDNRIANLREATHAENLRNRKRSKSNKSGYKGVHRQKQGNGWNAQISVGGKQLHLGSFSTAEDAHRAYVAAAIKFHGNFARAS